MGDHGLAFDAIKLSDKDGIIGYRLAVAITHRPHKIELLESTLYNVERRSPRPVKNHGHGGISALGGDHRRKLSFTSMNSKKMAKSVSAELAAAGTPTSDRDRDEVVEVKDKDKEEPVEKKGKKGKKKKKREEKDSDCSGVVSTSVLSPAKSKKAKKKKKKEKDKAKKDKAKSKKKD